MAEQQIQHRHTDEKSFLQIRALSSVLAYEVLLQLEACRETYSFVSKLLKQLNKHIKNQASTYF